MIPDLDMASKWSQLESTHAPGIHLLALDPRLSLSATITNPERSLGLLLEFDDSLEFDQKDLTGSEEVEVAVSDIGGRKAITLTLKHESFREMFIQLCDDLVPKVVSQTSESAAAATLVKRFGAWQRFLKRSAGRFLSLERQLGLYGELTTLSSFLFGTVGADKAVSSWTGPANAPQDFQIGRVAIEVKAVIQSEPQQLRIDGERQLDDFGLDALVVAHHRFFVHQDAGETLPDLVASIGDALSGDGVALDEFDNKLLAYGYRDTDADHYEARGYSLRDTSFYRVRPGFPRLTEDDLLPGVGALKYSIDASACGRFAVTSEDVSGWLGDPKSLPTSVFEDESQQVEYKQTAWTPAGPVDNPEHAAALARELRTSVLKTVVAFMNSDGGELVIGVADGDKAVTGIEVDLESKSRVSRDLDFYEQELVALFADQIDSRAHNQIRIRFDRHDAGTTCHVLVRPSPIPRFGHPPAKPNEKRRPVFWIRAGNTTRELAGDDLVGYIYEHWR